MNLALPNANSELGALRSALVVLVLKRFRNDIVRSPETADAFVSASQKARFRADEIGAAPRQNLDIFLRGRMQPHLCSSLVQ